MKALRVDLLAEAEALLAGEPSARMVDLLVTADGKHRSFFSFAEDVTDHEEREDAFFGGLCGERETRVEYLVCMWQGSVLDMPAYSLRRKLLELAPENGGACILLRTETGVNGWPLSETMPKS